GRGSGSSRSSGSSAASMQPQPPLVSVPARHGKRSASSRRLSIEQGPDVRHPLPVQSCVLLKFGEMILRGRNRRQFYVQLQQNVRRAMRGLGPVELRQRGGVLAVLAPEHPDELLARARDVLGVAVVHPVMLVERTLEAA